MNLPPSFVLCVLFKRLFILTFTMARTPVGFLLQGWEGAAEVQLFSHDMWRLCLWVKTISLVINISASPPSPPINLFFAKIRAYTGEKWFINWVPWTGKTPLNIFCRYFYCRDTFCNQFHSSQTIFQVYSQLSEKKPKNREEIIGNSSC